MSCCRPLLASGRGLSDLLLTEFPPVHFDLLVYNLFEMQELVIGKQLNFVRESYNVTKSLRSEQDWLEMSVICTENSPNQLSEDQLR